jgi:ABC-type Fe3+/spermidine/putrescine transport system ATPase subunit
MIELKNVSKWYGPVQVLNECTASIQKGEVVVVCGPSGSGKSTLIKTINALEPFQKGEITVDGIALHDPKTDLPKLRSRVGMVFQHFELFPHLSVTDNLTIAQIKVLGRSADDAKKRGLNDFRTPSPPLHCQTSPSHLPALLCPCCPFFPSFLLEPIWSTRNSLRSDATHPIPPNPSSRPPSNPAQPHLSAYQASCLLSASARCIVFVLGLVKFWGW